MTEQQAAPPSAQVTYEQLRDYLLTTDEQMLFRILPRQIADTLGAPPRPVLEQLVEAMFRGDTILHWEIRCPVCGRWGERPDWLRHAQHQHQCKACQSVFTVYLDEAAQVSFSPHPALRALGPGADNAELQQSLRKKYHPTTVQELLTIQSFRNWAREEPLPRGEYLEVRRIALWFSDLMGSTALYARSGDPRAYQRVREHFEIVFGTINENSGAVVKTIGDGVMAVFNSSEEAIQAALGAHRAIADYNQDQNIPAQDHLFLKVGIHCGPAIMVMLNDRLDYFGTTVNMASRISDLAEGTETTLSEAVFAGPGVASLLTNYEIESFQSHVRGLSESLTIYRVRAFPQPAP